MSLALKFHIELSDFLAQLLQCELQPSAPLAECCLWFGKHPGHAFKHRKVDFAGLAVKGVVTAVERRFVAARAGEQAVKVRHGRRLCRNTQKGVSNEKGSSYLFRRTKGNWKLWKKVTGPFFVTGPIKKGRTQRGVRRFLAAPLRGPAFLDRIGDSAIHDWGERRIRIEVGSETVPA